MLNELEEKPESSSGTDEDWIQFNIEIMRSIVLIISVQEGRTKEDYLRKLTEELNDQYDKWILRDTMESKLEDSGLV